MTSIQIRNCPKDIHAGLVSRAEEQGKSLQQYLLDLIKSDLMTPSIDEWIEELESQESVEFKGSVADIIREERSRLPSKNRSSR